jgi:cell division transport system permease protein
MKINNIGYLLKEGIRGIFLHGFMSFAAVFVTVACLLIVGSFTAITHNLSLMVEELNSNSEILAYVDDTYTLDKAQQVESRVRLVDNVSEADLVRREDALEEFRQSFKDPSLLDNVAPDTLQYRVRILLLDNTKLSETRDRLLLIPGVVEVSSPDGLIEGFTNLQEVLQVVSLVLIVILLFVSLLIISNTVKMAMADRKNEISIMKMVGATNGFIRLPFVVQGFTLGMLGAGVAFGLEWLLYDAMAGKINAYETLSFLSFVPFSQILPLMIPVFIGAGMFVGVVGSWNSIRKYMNV